MKPATRSSRQPLGGSNGDWRRRLLRFHLPLALASAMALVLFMTLPPFDPQAYPQVDMMAGGVIPQQVEPMDHSGGQTGPAENEIPRPEGEGQQHGGDQTGSRGHSGDQAGSREHGEEQSAGITPSPDVTQRRSSRFFVARLTRATGYVAMVLLALTLLIGPANLLLHKRNPVSSYLRRDVGMWTAIFSVVHVIFGLQLHSGGQLSRLLNYFVVDGSLLTNTFGLGNWTGLVALVIVVGLLALSSDFALRKLKARAWKNLQRLNYALFALVIAHAFFYGALLRMTSPFTLLLSLSIIMVFAGQAVGVWLWRHARTVASQRERQPAGPTG